MDTKLLLPLALLMALLGIASCSSGRSAYDPASDSTLRVATTIAPVADLIDRISDSTAQVHVLLPDGNTPESYEPTPQDLEVLAQCDAYLYVGNLGFETAWIDRIRELYPHLRLIRLDEGLEAYTCRTHHEGHIHDPHYWSSFIGALVMADNVHKALASLAPDQKLAYEATYTNLTDSIRSYLGVRTVSEELMSKAFVIYHPSLTYYADEAGIRQLVIEQDGKEPSPRAIEELIKEAKTLGVRYVFVQREFNPHLTESIAREIGAETVVINPLSRDWFGELKRIDALLRPTSAIE